MTNTSAKRSAAKRSVSVYAIPTAIRKKAAKNGDPKSSHVTSLVVIRRLSKC
jgi:hypothetical protein